MSGTAATTPYDVVVLPDIVWATDEDAARAEFVRVITDDPNLIRVSLHHDDIDIEEGDDAIGRAIGI